MKRLLALFLALACAAMLLTPALAAPDDEAGGDTSAGDTAGSDETGDTADDGANDGADSSAADDGAGADDGGEALTETAYQSIAVSCTVDEGGTAYIQATAELNIVGSESALSFVFPKGASKAAIEGYKTKSSTENGLKVLTITNDAGFTGVVSLQISYRLTDLVEAGEASQHFTLPLLAPQTYPIAVFSLAVTFPAAFSSAPAFESGYYKEVIEDLMTIDSSGGVVTAVTTTALKDHETLTMTLTLPEGYFSGNFGESLLPLIVAVLSALLTLAALLYWWRLLRNKSLRVSARSLPPDGVNPGDIPFLLAGGEADFNMLVSYWASLGYLSFFINQAGHVILRRRMEMGNERRAFERKLFLLLFGDESYCDGASLHYKKVGAKAMAVIPRYWARRLYDKRSGSPFLARLMASAACALATFVAMDALAPEALHWLYLIAALVAGFALSHLMQQAAGAYYLGDWVRNGVGLGCGALLLLVGLLGGAGLLMTAAAGVSAFVAWQTAHGGKRRSEGDEIIAQTLGFRRFMHNATDHHAKQMLRRDEQYFYKMLPYAEAMGQGRHFTGLFHGVRLERCPWYEAANGTPTTPAAFYEHYQETLAILNVSIRK